VSSDLAPMAVMLRRAGLHSPKLAVWKRAVTLDGIEYDLDTELNLSRSQPQVERDEPGKIKRGVFPSRKAATGFIKGLQSKGKKMRFTETKLPGIQLSMLTFKFGIGADLRRLTIKMSVATAELMRCGTSILDTVSRAFLLGQVTQRRRVTGAIDFLGKPRRVKIFPQKGSPAVEIISTRPVIPTITKLQGPLRLVIDLPNATMSEGRKRIEIHSEDISTVRMNQYVMTPPVARVVLDLLRPLSYTWDAAGNRLRIRVPSRRPLPSPDWAAQPADGMEMRAARQQRTRARIRQPRRAKWLIIADIAHTR